MIESNLFLILASGEENGKGYWLIDKTYDEFPIAENKKLIECYRKELIGKDSAKEILYAINLNILNLYADLEKDGFVIDTPPKGISFSIPLETLEEIFDFWFELYKKADIWETCIGLLKIRQRYSLNKLIMSNAVKGNAKKWAPVIEDLHNYRPNLIKPCEEKEPMWF